MKTIKRITAAVLAAAMTAGAIMTTASAAYIEDKSWSISYVNQLPSRPEGSDDVEVDVYTGGYQTYCENISGGNDRYVLVKATGLSDFNITQKGYSSIKRYTPQSGVTKVTFSFYGRSSTTCIADGTVGYVM